MAAVLEGDAVLVDGVNEIVVDVLLVVVIIVDSEFIVIPKSMLIIRLDLKQILDHH